MLLLATVVTSAVAQVQVVPGGGARLVYGLSRGDDFGRAPVDGDGALLLRAFGSLDVGSERVGGMVQLNSALQVGRDPAAFPLDVDRLHVQQAYVRVDTEHVALRVGRAEWRLGNGLLVDLREGPNVRRAFDGAHLVVTGPRELTVDLVAGSEVQARPGVFDDAPSLTNLLWGIYADVDSPWLPGARHSVYYLGARVQELAYLEGAGSEVRHSVGTRLHGGSETTTYDVEVLHQRRRLDADTGLSAVSAWGAAGQVRQALGLPWHPALTLEAGVSSGDGQVGDQRLGTFRAPFPEIRALGAVTQLAPSNTFGVNPGFSLAPAKSVVIVGVGRALWRTSRSDALYAIPGFPSRVSDSDARFIGAGGSATVLLFPALGPTWRCSPTRSCRVPSSRAPLPPNRAGWWPPP